MEGNGKKLELLCLSQLCKYLNKTKSAMELDIGTVCYRSYEEMTDLAETLFNQTHRANVSSTSSARNICMNTS